MDVIRNEGDFELLNITLEHSLVKTVSTPSESPFRGRLQVGDPIEKVLDATIEAYHHNPDPV